MKYKVRYFTEFGIRETILKESELVRFIYRFKVSSIEALANVSNQRELLLAFAGWLYGNLDKEVEERIVDDYLNSK